MNTQENKTILLVEDEVIIALAESKTIRQFGYKVIMAHNGDEAVRGATGHAGGIDLVLMDIDLGKGIDGTESGRWILEKRKISPSYSSPRTTSGKWLSACGESRATGM